MIYYKDYVYYLGLRMIYYKDYVYYLGLRRRREEFNTFIGYYFCIRKKV